MPRSARILPPSAMLHLIGRGNNNVRTFRRYDDFANFLFTLIRYSHDSGIFIHHYILMHTHFHLLAWVEDTKKLAGIIKSACIAYHSYFTKRYEYKGHLWHGRFKSIIIKDDSQWLQCARYIELNSVYAGICKDPKDFRWSSYHYYARGKKDELLRPIFYPMGEIRHNPGKINDAYRQFVLSGMDIDYQKLKKQFEKENFMTSKNAPAKKTIMVSN